MSTNADSAAQMFGQGFNCTQAVLTSCGQRYGLDARTAWRVAQAFGGGMGLMGLTCGAVTGAFMVIGLAQGALGPTDQAAKQRAYDLARRFAARFGQGHGSICCRDLLGCDIATAEGMRQAREKGLFKSVCPALVRDAVEVVEQLLAGSEDTR